MRSSRCPNCSLTQAETNVCKRCGTAITEAPPPPRQNFAPAANSHWNSPATQNYASSHSGKLKTGLAVTSLVLAIVALPTMFLLIGLLLAPVAVILGVVAFRKAGKAPQVYGGKGLAVAGIVVGAIVSVVFVPIILAIAIPNLYAAKSAADEMAAFDVFEKIAVAQDKNVMASGNCGDLQELLAKGMIDAETAKGEKYGYKFTASGKATDPLKCETRATPIDGKNGARSLYFSNSDNVMRVERNGMVASNASQPLKGSK